MKNSFFTYLFGGLLFAILGYKLLPKWCKRWIFSVFVLVKTLVYVKIHNFRHHNKSFSTADLFEENVDKYPSRLQLISVETKTQVNLSQLDELANKLAWYLLKNGCVAGDVVALLMLNRIEFFAIEIACAKVGLTCSLINSSLKGEPLLHSLKVSLANSKSKMLIHDIEIDISIEDRESIKNEGITADSNILTFNSSKECVFNENFFKEFSSQRPGKNMRKHVKESDPYLFIFTSGTTGYPKASKISHSKHYCASLPYGIMCELNSTDCIYTTMPLYHSAAGVLGAATALRTGACMVFRKKFSASNFVADCVDFKITSFQYIGEFARYLLNTPVSNKEINLNIKNCFGNGLRADIWTKFQTRFRIKHIIELYGSTEGNCALFNSADRVGALGFIPRFLDILYPVVILRTDPANPTEPLRDMNGRCSIAPPNTAGLLCSSIQNDRVDRRFDGYTDSAATSKKILKGVFKQGDNFFNTGDLITRDDIGFFYWCDRLGDTFRWKCENVSTSQVESIFAQCSDVAESNVYGVEIPNADGRAGMAAIVLNKGLMLDKFNWSRLSEVFEKNLPIYARPLFIRIKDVLETTVTYKHIKTNLITEGFDLSKCGSDPIFVYLFKEKQYQRLTPDILEKIQNGVIQF